MNHPRTAWDGHPRSAGTGGMAMTGEEPAYSLAGLREGVIVERFYPDEEGNRSQKYMEYTVRDTATGFPYHGARVVFSRAGLEDGEEITLHPAEKTVDGGPKTEFTRATDLDGDFVLFGFIDGSPDRPVIVGVLPHPRTKYGGTKDDKERRFLTHKGTSVEIKDDGSFIITRKDGDDVLSTVKIEDGGDVEIKRGDKTVIRLEDNTAKVDAETVEIGPTATTVKVAGETDFMLLGTFVRGQWKTMNQAIATALNGVTPGPQVVASIVTALQGVSGAIRAFESAMTGHQDGLSQKAKLG